MMKITFVCDGNLACSQEAQAFLNDLSKGRRASAIIGVNPKSGKHIDSLVVQVMSGLKCSMDEGMRKPIDESAVVNADMIVSIKPASALSEFVHVMRVYDIGM